MVWQIDSQEAVKHIADLMKKSRKTVVFTGAGMSTESGIPDFRSSGGLWDGQDPMKISHVNILNSSPWLTARFYRDRMRQMGACTPNRGHYILAEWETQGKIWGIATQNIDGFHSRAGNKNVCELHGNLDLYCWFCQSPYKQGIYTETETDDEFWHCTMVSDTEQNGIVPCGGVIRPNVTLFGEDLPQVPYQRALQHHAQADLCIILGSSCKVAPANGLPQHTVANGGQVVIINQSETDLDYLASYKISDWSISKALEEINKNLLTESTNP